MKEVGGGGCSGDPWIVAVVEKVKSSHRWVRL